MQFGVLKRACLRPASETVSFNWLSLLFVSSALINLGKLRIHLQL